MLSLSDIESARERIRGVLAPTPLVRSDPLSDTVGRDVWIKLEMLQPTRSFKVRGALSAVLGRKGGSREVFAASGGNHGAAVAYAARHAGIRATVVVPESTSDARRRAIAELGARVIAHGIDFNAAHAHAIDSALEAGADYVHPFDDVRVMAGQGTIGLELAEELDVVGAVVCAVGGGGLAAGVGTALAAKWTRARLLVVQPSGGDAVIQSLERRALVEIERFESFAKSLGTRKTTERVLDRLLELDAVPLRVSDADAARGVLRLLDAHGLSAELAAGCALAALEHPRMRELLDGIVGPIVVIACGASLDRSELATMETLARAGA